MPYKAREDKERSRKRVLWKALKVAEQNVMQQGRQNPQVLEFMTAFLIKNVWTSTSKKNAIAKY